MVLGTSDIGLKVAYAYFSSLPMGEICMRQLRIKGIYRKRSQ